MEKENWFDEKDIREESHTENGDTLQFRFVVGIFEVDYFSLVNTDVRDKFNNIYANVTVQADGHVLPKPKISNHGYIINSGAKQRPLRLPDETVNLLSRRVMEIIRIRKLPKKY